MFIDLSRENNRKKAVNEEKIFLEKLGLSFIPYMEDGNAGSISRNGNVIGFILSDDFGDLKTRINGNDISADYLIEDEVDGIIYRNVTLTVNSRNIELRNIHTDEFDYLECMDDKDSYSLTFTDEEISSMNLSREIHNDESTNSVIEKFREVCPELVNYLINKYGDNPKQKTRQ